MSTRTSTKGNQPRMHKTPQEAQAQLDKLDATLGKGVGAKRERARLTEIIESAGYSVAQ